MAPDQPLHRPAPRRKTRLHASVPAILAALIVTACGGGGGGSGNGTPATDLPASESEALLFLQRATFGPDEASLARLQQLGYRAWLQEQRNQPTSLQEPGLTALANGGTTLGQSHRQEAWWRNSVAGPDQLRQRVAFALSQIFVVSDRDPNLSSDVIGLGHYYDLLAQSAFGNYRALLGQVTLHPMMAVYLSFLRNRKPDPARNIRPDENYAREVMQLFSIGLAQLNQDGTPQVDNQGQEIPTYSQEDIEGLAHVFTGWNYSGYRSWTNAPPNLLPLVADENFHDRNAKTILGNVVFPPGRDAPTELNEALDLLANHANVGPFLGKQLIQRLVTSNPSPAYVARVAAVWANDGSGVRGNLAAVVDAVLLDTEAFTGHTTMPNTFGKLREGLLLQTAVWRAFAARAEDGRYVFNNPESVYGQAALRSETVFNFFRPDHVPQGELTSLGLAAPEFQILDANTAIAGSNQLYRSVITNYVGRTSPPAGEPLVDLTQATALAADTEALISHLDRILMAHLMPESLKGVVRNHVDQLTNPLRRANEAIWLVVTSPQFAVQK